MTFDADVSGNSEPIYRSRVVSIARLVGISLNLLCGLTWPLSGRRDLEYWDFDLKPCVLSALKVSLQTCTYLFWHLWNLTFNFFFLYLLKSKSMNVEDFMCSVIYCAKFHEPVFLRSFHYKVWEQTHTHGPTSRSQALWRRRQVVIWNCSMEQVTETMIH